MKKRQQGVFASIAVVTTMALALAGCGDSQGGGKETVDADGKTVVTFWQNQFTKDEDAWYKERVEAFNSSQDKIKVDYKVIPGDAWDQKMKAASAAKTAPDVYTRAYNQIPMLKGQGAIKPLGDLIDDSAWSDIEDNILDMVKVEGEPYAYPILVEPSMVLYYRTDLFEAAGLDPASPPTTWAQLLEYGKKLGQGDEVFGLAMPQNTTDMTWSTWGLQQGLGDGSLPITDDFSKALGDDEKYTPLFQLFQDLYSTGVMPKQALAPAYPEASPFGEGKLAMMANGSWATGQLMSEYPDIIKNTAVAKFPSLDGNPETTTSTLGGWTLVVDGNSKVDKAAAEFISFIYAGETAELVQYFEETLFGKFPARKSVNEEIAKNPESETINPFRETIATKIVPFSGPEATYDWSVSLSFAEGLEAAMQGTPVKDAQADAQGKMTTQIEKLGLAGTGPGSKK